MPAEQFRPLYRQIIDDIRRRIASGEWPPGTKTPSTRELQRMYDVPSPTTVRQAILILQETGELRGHQGRGVYVAERSQQEQ